MLKVWIDAGSLNKQFSRAYQSNYLVAIIPVNSGFSPECQFVSSNINK